MKFNFETPGTEIPHEAESKKDGQSVLERLYKSKSARAVAFAAALFGAGAIAESAASKHPKNESAITGAVEKDELRLEGLSEKFKTEVLVPGGDQTILHIGQAHAIALEGKLAGDEEVVSSQKSVEELLSYLKDKGLADTVYAEGMTQQFINEIDIAKHMTPEDLVRAIKSMDDPQSNISNTTKSYYLYSAKCELLRKANDLDAKYQISLKEGQLPRPEIESLIESIKKNAAEIGNDERIRGDNAYLVGAAFKMYCEGKITLKGASSKQADQETMAPYSLAEKLVFDENQKYRHRHEIRENAALDLISRDAPILREKIIPLVYGASHNFTGAVKDWDKKAGSQKFGLTRVEAK